MSQKNSNKLEFILTLKRKLSQGVTQLQSKLENINNFSHNKCEVVCSATVYDRSAMLPHLDGQGKNLISDLKAMPWNFQSIVKGLAFYFHQRPIASKTAKKELWCLDSTITTFGRHQQDRRIGDSKDIDLLPDTIPFSAKLNDGDTKVDIFPETKNLRVMTEEFGLQWPNFGASYHIEGVFLKVALSFEVVVFALSLIDYHWKGVKSNLLFVPIKNQPVKWKIIPFLIMEHSQSIKNGISYLFNYFNKQPIFTSSIGWIGDIEPGAPSDNLAKNQIQGGSVQGQILPALAQGVINNQNSSSSGNKISKIEINTNDRIDSASLSAFFQNWGLA